MATLDIRGKTVLLDDDDLELVSKYKWFFTPQGYVCTTLRVSPGKKGRRTIGMHRLILGDPDSKAVDHINRNKTAIKGKKSIYRGVSPHRGARQVVIRINGVLTWMGRYKTEEEAALIASPYFADVEA